MEITFAEMYSGIGGFKALNMSSSLNGIGGLTKMKKGFKFPPHSKLDKNIPRDTLVEMYAQKNMTLMEIASTLNSGYKHIWRLFDYYGIPRRIAKKRNQTSEKNDNWKGGEITRNGYIEVQCMGHPRARKKGHYVPKQVLVMEIRLGRYLKENEVVHHINGDKTDNRIENLQLMSKSGNESHIGLHNRLRVGGD